MDPLSVTLAAVSLATAVQDLVKLGQKIHESFAKVSNNLRNAQRVAENIREMVEEIKTFCEDHKDTLDNMREFRMSLQSLLGKLRSFETSILPLLPNPGRSKLGPFIRGWWNNTKIEESVLHLESDIVRVMRKYMMASTMRIEVKQGTDHQETLRGLADMHNDVRHGLQVLAVVEKNVSAITATTMPWSSYESLGTGSEELNRSVIKFAQSSPSTSVPMLRTPDMITEEVATTAYIKVQINSIATILEKMPMLPASTDNDTVSNAVNVTAFQLDHTHEVASMGIANLRRYVVRQVTVVHDLLSSPGIHTISVQDGTIILDRLSTELNALNMHHESMLVGVWAVMLARMLVDATGGRHSGWRGSLALSLYNQSILHRMDGDDTQRLRTIEEAFTISQDLCNQHPRYGNFQILHSIVLSRYAELVNKQRSIELTIKAVQVLEDILNVQAFTLSDLHGMIETVVRPTATFFDRLFSLGPPTSAIIDYAFTLQSLGIHMVRHGPDRHQSALALVHLGLAVHRRVVLIHGHVHKVDLARALSSLVHSEAARCIPAEEIIGIADECIELLRELLEKNPVLYARELIKVLWKKASTLVDLNREAESIGPWEQVTSLAGHILHDSALCAHTLDHLSDQFRHLKRHSDAVRTGTLAITMYQEDQARAIRYLDLSRDLHRVQRYKDSAEAARTSVALYRRLAMGDPKTWMSYLTRGVSHLSLCLAASGDHYEALNAWKESVDMLNNFLKIKQAGSCDVLGGYLDALDISRCLGYVLQDEIECIKIHSTTCQYLRLLLAIYPTMATVHLDLVWSEFSYANNLLRLGCLQDAQEVIDHWLDMRSCRPDAMPESKFAAVYAAMVILKADVLDAQGCIEQALLTTMKVHDIVKPFISTDQSCFSQMVDSRIHEAVLQLDFGNSVQALQVVEEALQLSRNSELQPIVENVVWSLHATALTAFMCQDYKRAVEAAHEGCIMSSTSDWQDIETEHNIFIRPSLWAILSSAEANLGRSTAVEHAHHAVAMSLEIRDMKADVSATTAEKSYMETRGYLAHALVATGDLVQVRQICEERSAYFSKRVEKRMGEYRDLAPVLRMLGILCCSEGRHEEGDAAAQELSQMMKKLENVFPSLQEQVKIRLRRQTQVPILKVLDDMCQKLDCGHQTEVASLFAI